MVEPDVWIPRLTNGEEGLLEQASDFPKHVNPNDVEDLDDLFMYENQLHGWSQAPSSSVVIEELPDSPKRKLEVNNAAKGRYKVCAKRKALPGVKIVDPRDEVPTQASRTPVVMDKSNGKRKMEMEEQTGDSDSEEDDSEDGSYEKGTDDEDGESNDDDYDPAKNDDDVAVYGIDDDYLFDWLTEAEGNDKGPEASIFPAIEEGSECDEDDEAMFGAVDSDEEAIGEEYDSDGKVKYPEFNPKVDMQNPRFCKGMLFATLQILREAITERAIQKGWEPYYEKSDKSRVRVFCKAMDCEFELFASQKENSNTFQIKTYKGSHNCARVQENCAVKVPYLVRKFSDMIKMNPNIATVFGGSKYVVDLQRRTCGCRRWNLTGIPCKHAVSAIYFMREKPEDYMDACYLKKTYLATYSHTIQPVNGMDLWMPSDEPVILPPQYNRQPGRPKKNRNKEAAERENDGPKLGRVQKSLKCSNCHRWGHNKKTCHRHLPPKTPVTNAQKRKLNTGEASSSKAKGTKPPPKSKNDLRMKAALKAKNMKEKRAKEKAAARAATSKGRPPIASSTSAQGSQASSRASVRLRAKNSGK